MWLGALFNVKQIYPLSTPFHLTLPIHFFYNSIHNAVGIILVIIFCDDTYKYSLRQKSAQFRIAPSQDTLCYYLIILTLLPIHLYNKDNISWYCTDKHIWTQFSFGNELSICASIYNLGQSGPSYYKNQDYTLWKYYMGFLKFLNCLIGLDYDI